MSEPVSSDAILDREQMPKATRAAIRTNRDRLMALAAGHALDITRVADDGRLVIEVGQDRDYFDVVMFESEASELLGMDVTAVPAAVLHQPDTTLDARTLSTL